MQSGGDAASSSGHAGPSASMRPSPARHNPKAATNGETAPSSQAAAEPSRAEQEAGLLGTRRPTPHRLWTRKGIRVLVVGDSGLGKSTLIKALMSTPLERVPFNNGTHEQFNKNPSALLSSVSWREETDRVIYTFAMQDTPGFGHLQDPDEGLCNVVDFIERQNQQRLNAELSVQRHMDVEEVEDPRVDLCLFCIGPHRLRPVELKYMYEIGLHVPVVPVVTKADTMTVREAEVYRTEVANKIANPMVKGIHGAINVFHFERDALERAGIHDGGEPRPPFFVIASNDVNEERSAADQPTFWPERAYSWGVAEAFNRDHSDLLSLRALLFKEALTQIIRSKRERYEDWRKRRLRRDWARRKLWQLLGWVVLPAFMYRVGRSAPRRAAEN